jgi:hypothetical protein
LTAKVKLPAQLRERVLNELRQSKSNNTDGAVPDVIDRIEAAIGEYRARLPEKAAAIKKERHFLKYRAPAADLEKTNTKPNRPGRRVPMSDSAAVFGVRESQRRISQLSTDKTAERWLIRELALILKNSGVAASASKDSLLIPLLNRAFGPLKDNSIQRSIRQALVQRRSAR